MQPARLGMRVMHLGCYVPAVLLMPTCCAMAAWQCSKSVARTAGQPTWHLAPSALHRFTSSGMLFSASVF